MTKLDGRTGAAAQPAVGRILATVKTDHIDLVQIHEVIRPGDPNRHFSRET